MDIETTDGRTIHIEIDSFNNRTLLKDNFHRAILKDVLIDNCTFDSCDMRGSYFKNVTKNNVTFKNCSMATCEFNEVKGKKIHFINCILSYVNFKNVKFEQLVFENCNLSGKFVNVQFSNAFFKEGSITDFSTDNFIIEFT